MKILLGVTGSVASTLLPKLLERLWQENHDVQIVATQKAEYFFKKDVFTRLGVRIWRDSDEWSGDEYQRDQDIPHISLAKWADVLLIAPLSADTLAKIANGMCDNMLTSLVRAWPRDKRIVLAPAMNTVMWEHPVTEEHLDKIRKWYSRFVILFPQTKHLACGDIGVGAMADIGLILAYLKT